MLERLDRVSVATSATTRAMRAGETDGVEYRFLTREDFAAGIDRGGFLEHAEYAGNLYGTLRSEVARRLSDGDSVILEIELNGARMVRASAPDALAVFIAPPSFEELESRLRGRGTDAAEDIDRRLSVARTELAAREEFDVVIVNDDVERATKTLVQVMEDRTSAMVKADT